MAEIIEYLIKAYVVAGITNYIFINLIDLTTHVFRDNGRIGLYRDEKSIKNALYLIFIPFANIIGMVMLPLLFFTALALGEDDSKC